MTEAYFWKPLHWDLCDGPNKGLKVFVTFFDFNRLPSVETTIFGAALHGGKAELVRIEVLLSRGIPRTLLVGMPDAHAKEARERLPSALANHGFAFPKGKILFNLVPAQIPKGGLPLDLALAGALLQAQGQLKKMMSSTLLLAELDLQGCLRPPSRGTLLAALEASKSTQVKTVVTAPEAAQEASIAPGIQAVGLKDLGEVISFLNGELNPKLPPTESSSSRVDSTKFPLGIKLEDIRGQSHARWAGILSIIGRHPLLLQGPPGTGKSMLARRLAGLLPPLCPSTALEVAQIEALVGPVNMLPTAPPFRAPHPSVSAQGIFGGGRPLRPGEISRAHGGLLFLDELPEFQRPVLEGMRQPLEEKEVRIQRAQEWATFPADVLLIAARNPCPCGFHTHPVIPCTCTPHRYASYQSKTSGPLLDRFDLFAEMSPIPPEDLQGPASSPTQQEALQWIAKAKKKQDLRTERGSFAQSSEASLEELRAEGIEQLAWSVMLQAAERLSLSSRGTLRTLRVARSLADMTSQAQVQKEHVLKALSFRPLTSTAGASIN